MNILLLAPHPFYQERGTPIAVDMLLGVLDQDGHQVDVVTYHEGRERSYKNVVIHRIKPWIKVKNIRPGFSFKKLYCDFFLMFSAVKLLRRRRFDLVHAVEESSFMALCFRRVFNTPFVYDMDSLMSTQLLDRFPMLSFAARPIAWIESLPIKRAKMVAPMCDDLADEAGRYRDGGIVLVKDVSLVKADDDGGQGDDLRQELQITDGKIVMYIGNLEPYQGIDLLLSSFKELCRSRADIHLVLIGGVWRDIEHYRAYATELGLERRVHLLGPRPVDHIGHYMKQADLLVSPRIHGTNTPMKIYSYLHSGTAVVATDLATHTQVLNRDIAVLTAPEPKAFAEAMAVLLEDAQLRQELGQRAAAYAQREHSYERFVDSVRQLYPPVTGYPEGAV
jgi:glycosyltransferase involved in cell wall biosynthesis